MSQKMLEAALDYADRGWPIFPTRVDKTPHNKHGVLEATTNREQIKEWWKRWPGANIAMDVGGAGMMVIDLDPGHDLKQLEDNLDGLPDTALRAKTPRGGEHLFYLLDHGEIVSPSTSKLADHVDVRSFNSYVLLAPSTTADGTYTWEAQGKPARRTDEMVRQSNTYREKHDDRDTWLIEPDMPEHVEAAVRWLKTDARIAVEGMGGDHVAYATAAYMKSFGLSEKMAMELIWDHWNPRCIPPWGADEYDHLERKVQNAYAYNTSPPGNITEAYKIATRSRLFEPVTTRVDGKGLCTTSGRFKFYDREGLAQIKPPEWLFAGLLPEQSFAILFGAPGTFKTFIALDLALSLATGFPLDPIWNVEQSKCGPVLFAAGEGHAGMARRIRAWEQEHNGGREVLRNFYLGAPVPRILSEADIDEFVAGAKALRPDGYRLAVIDTVGRAMQGANENSQEYASMFTHMVEIIQAELGCAVLALHHTGHGDGKRERGSTVFGADADCRFLVSREENNGYGVTLEVLKQKDAPELAPTKIGLKKVVFEDGTDSLAAVKPNAKPAAAPNAPQSDRTASPSERRSKNDPRGPDPIVLDVVEDAIIASLQQIKNKRWSDADLAVAVAMSEGVEIGSETLRKKTFKLLREDKARQSNRLYDPVGKRWRWVE